jgi:hypothetical protein
MRSLLTTIVLALAVAGCGDDNKGGGDSGAPMDLSVAVGPDMFLLSRCGHPGDVGNSLGVGQFCTNQGPDCTANSKAKSCSALFNGQTPSADDTYFCSFQCMATDPPGTCGDNAACLCNSSGICACIPTKCIPPGDGGP